ncbi:MAG: hypothetical protein ACFFC7_20350, partial [Candidatus Hermodarchaeota archaeon]
MTKWAFLVGVSEYEDEQINPIPYSETHVQSLYEILKDSGEYTQIVILSSSGDKPDKNNIIKKFQRLIQKIKIN